MRRGVVAVVAVILAIAAGAAASWYVRESTPKTHAVSAAPPPVPVVAAVVTRRDVPQIVPALGTVQSIDTVNVTPQVNGRITRIYFKPGDAVKAGQKLFEIDPRPYQAALNQVEGQLARDQAALNAAKADYNRYHTLLAENSIARQTVADQAATVQQDAATITQDEANIANAKLNLSFTEVTAPISGRTGPLQVDLGNYVTASSGASPASAGTSAGGGGAATGAAVTTSGTVTPPAPAPAPTALAAPGGASGATLVTITQMHPIYVTFNVPETELDTIRENQAKAPLAVEAYSQSGKLIASGKLAVISNQVNAATGTILLQATFPNKREVLWPNQFVSVRLTAFTRNNVVTVPTPAVMTGGTGPYVYVIGTGNKVQRVAVQITASAGNIDVIGKGLKAGQLVVTQGQYRLDNGVVVSFKSPQPAAPTPAGQGVASAPAPAPPATAGTTTAFARGSATASSGD